jgi:hypothetical protein
MDEQELEPTPKRPTRQRRSRAKAAASKASSKQPKKGKAELLPPVDTGIDAPSEGAKTSGSKRRRRTASARVAAPPPAPPPSPAQVPLEPVGRPWIVRIGTVRREATAGPLGPRRMLVRDASSVLIVLALLVLAASQIPMAPASGEESPSVPGPGGSGGIQIPRGTLNLFSPTPVQSLAAGETPRPTFDVTHATLPPWCANPTCTVFVTPSPSPTPSPKPTATPAATPTPLPTATPIPTPSPTQVAVPGFSCGTTGGEYADTLDSVNLKAGGHYASGDIVVSVNPAVGTMVNVGSSVKITTDSSPPPCP